MYNVEDYVETCLKSLIQQTFKEIEIFAISDGSKDQSEAIARKFSQQDERIQVFSKENGGYGSVLEYAIEKIESEYFIICDPDDWLEPQAIELLYKSAKENDLDIVCGNRYFVYMDDTNDKLIDDMSRTYHPNNKEIAMGKEKDKYYHFFPTPHAKLYRTSVCKEIHFPHHVSFTDFTLFMLALNHSKKVMYLDQPLANYLIDRPGNSMTDRRSKVVQDHITVYQSVTSQIVDWNVSLKYRLYKEYLIIMLSYYTSAQKLLEKDLLKQMNVIRKEVKGFYKEINTEFHLAHAEKLKYFFTTNSWLSMMACIIARWISNNK